MSGPSHFDGAAAEVQRERICAFVDLDHPLGQIRVGVNWEEATKLGKSIKDATTGVLHH